jgi:hypothetical protein
MSELAVHVCRYMPMLRVCLDPVYTYVLGTQWPKAKKYVPDNSLALAHVTLKASTVASAAGYKPVPRGVTYHHEAG